MLSNRFYFAVPKDLIKVDEIPHYSGLIYVHKYGYVEIIKKAPLIHKIKHDYKNVFDKMYYAYEKKISEIFSIKNTNTYEF